MSLLNQMLNDLDRRRAEDRGARALHRDVRPLPPAPAGGRRTAWLLGLLLVALLVAGGGWLLAGPGWGGAGAASPGVPTNAPSIAPSNVPSNAPQVVPSVVAATLPELSVPATAPLPEPVPAISAAAPAKEAAAPREPRPFAAARPAASLKLSDALSPPAGGAPAAGATPLAAAPTADGNIDKRVLEVNLREQAERLYRSAQSQLAQGREADAANTLRVLLRDQPDHLAARQLLIKLGIDRRAFDQAQLDLEEGLRRLPRQTTWAMLLARLHVERGDAAGGLAVLERHEAYANGAADYQAAMAAMLQRLNRQAEAEARFQRATQAEPANGRWWLGLGLAREAQGQAAAAREAFRAALGASGLSEELRAFAEAKLR